MLSYPFVSGFSSRGACATGVVRVLGLCFCPRNPAVRFARFRGYKKIALVARLRGRRPAEREGLQRSGVWATSSCSRVASGGADASPWESNRCGGTAGVISAFLSGIVWRMILPTQRMHRSPPRATRRDVARQTTLPHFPAGAHLALPLLSPRPTCTASGTWHQNQIESRMDITIFALGAAVSAICALRVTEHIEYRRVVLGD